MNQEEKAAKYDSLIAQNDRFARELSKLQSANTGVNTTSDEYDKRVSFLKNKMLTIEGEMRKLFY